MMTRYERYVAVGGFFWKLSKRNFLGIGKFWHKVYLCIARHALNISVKKAGENG